jgi:hypothetical protein
MTKLSKFSAWCLLTIIATLVGAAGDNAFSQSVSTKGFAVNPTINVVVRTDRERYLLADSVKISASLVNSGDALIYVDRRMFWTGLSGGLELDITDEHGNHLPVRVLSDAMMPPPMEGDASILVRLDPGFFYGVR